MKLDINAFADIPHLKDKILDPQTSRFRDLDLEEMDRAAQQNGLGPEWRRTDEDRERTRQDTLSGRDGQDLWVFAFGSLMWDPAFYFDAVRMGKALGYERSFCLHLPSGRGSVERPGLMAALDVGDVCEGLVFHIDADHVETETKVIWKREMISYGYSPTFIPVETEKGVVDALAFVVNHDSDRYVSGLSEEEAARRIAQAKGILGSNLAYLDSLAAQLEVLGLHDEKFNALYHRARALSESEKV